MALMMFLDSPTAVGVSNMFLRKDLFLPCNPRFSRAGISPETSKFSPGSGTPISPVKVPRSRLGQIPESVAAFHKGKSRLEGWLIPESKYQKTDTYSCGHPSFDALCENGS